MTAPRGERRGPAFRKKPGFFSRGYLVAAAQTLPGTGKNRFFRIFPPFLPCFPVEKWPTLSLIIAIRAAD
jgi:hypothetical protein